MEWAVNIKCLWLSKFSLKMTFKVVCPEMAEDTTWLDYQKKTNVHQSSGSKLIKLYPLRFCLLVFKPRQWEAMWSKSQCFRPLDLWASFGKKIPDSYLENDLKTLDDSNTYWSRHLCGLIINLFMYTIGWI